MALLNTKFDEDTMYGQLKGALLPNENIKAAVYATFQDMSFFGSRASQVGFVALTDQDRLIGMRHSMLGSTPFSGYLGLLKKLKLKKGLLLGARTIDYDDGNVHLRITAVPKVAGAKFPHQQENFQTLISALEPRQI